MAAPLWSTRYMLSAFKSSYRWFTCKSYQFSKYKLDKKVRGMKQSDKYLQKKLQSGKPSKKIWHESLPLSPMSSFMKSRSGPSASAVRRSRQLSVVLHEYITSLINSGEVEPRLADLGIDIVKVWIPPAFNVVNIYWLASGTATDEEIQKILPDTAFKLRAALVSLHVMGHLPPVQFVKDLSAARLQQVQALLDQADMGPDFVPTNLGEIMKSTPHLKYDASTCSPSLQARLSQVAENMNNKYIEDNYGPTGARKVRLENLDRSSSDTESRHPTLSSDHAEGVTENCNEIMFEPDLEDSTDLIATFDNLNLRTDIYDVDHSSLLQQVVHTKRKVRDRFYDKEDSETITAPDSSQTVTDHGHVKKYLAKKRRKEKQLDHADQDVLPFSYSQIPSHKYELSSEDTGSDYENDGNDHDFEEDYIYMEEDSGQDKDNVLEPMNK